MEAHYSIFIRPFVPVIDEYVKDNIKPDYSSIYKEFVPVVVNRIEKIAIEVFKTARERLKQDSSSITRVPDDYVLDSKAASIMRDIFKKQYSLDVRFYKAGFLNQDPHSLGYLFSLCDCHLGNFYIGLGSKSITENPYLNYDCYGQYDENLKEASIEIPEHYNSPRDIISDMYASSKSDHFKGIQLISGTGEVFKVHKSILKQHKFFQTLLSSPMKESNENKINLSEIDSRTLDNFVRFLYAQPLDYNEEFDLELVTTLYEMGKMYEYDKLVKFCSITINHWVEKYKINEENFSLLFYFGSVHENNKILSRCIEWAENNETGQSLLLSMINENNIELVKSLASAEGRTAVKDLLEQRKPYIMEIEKKAL